MQRYTVTGPRPVLDAAPGESFEHEFTEAEEQAHLLAKRLEIVPRRYQVVGHRRVLDTPTGEFFEAAFSIPQERSLIEGGHIERADKAAQKAAGKTNDKSKE